MDDLALRLSETECEQLLDALFPHRLEGAAVLAALAPEGWERSSLRLFSHPTAEQLFEESVRIHRNLSRLGRRKDAAPPSPEPTLEQFRAEHEEPPFEPERECRDLLGMCLWDIFADNHEVIALDGRVCDLGSFRAAGGFLADWLNRRLGLPATPEPDIATLAEPGGIEAYFASLTSGPGYSYLDFYMGTSMIRGRASLLPVYEFIFERLRAHGCDWRYSFPRLHLIDLKPLRDEMKLESDEPEWANYSPAAAFAEAEEEQEEEDKSAELRASLEEAHKEDVARAQDAPPPETVEAYRRVFGEFPSGWPPALEE